MKKIYSFALAAVALISAASCQEELANFEPQTEGGDFTVTALASAESKTVLDGVNVYWTPGDKIGIFDTDGNSVEFSTNITEKSATATFSSNNFSAPESLLAIYPSRAGVATYDGTKIVQLRIAGTQKAVAGSFDPDFGVALGTPIEAGSTELQFKNIHTLVKFTIGGELAPSTVSLKSFAGRMCTGLFYHNPTTGETACTDGGHEVTLTAPEGGFKVGETYYIALVPGATKELTLYFDGVAVKSLGKDVVKELLANKIYNLGTIEISEPKPTPEEADLKATRLWVKTASEIGLTGGKARNCTTDGQYVYVANSSDNAGIKAYSVADPSIVKDVTLKLHTAVLTSGTHPISCVRMLPNPNGEPVLVASNLTTGDGTAKLTIYVWANGIDAEPNYYVIDSGTRRLGDKFTVNGNYEAGELWFRDYNNETSVVRVAVANGVCGSWGTPDLAYALGKWDINTIGGIGEVYAYPGQASPALIVTTNSGKFVENSAVVEWKWDPNITKTFGYNFFELNGNKYIAYSSLNTTMNNGFLNIIEDKGTATDFKNTLELQNKKLSHPILDTDSNEAASHSVSDCCVFVDADGSVYAAALAQNCGLAYFKIEKK